MKVLMAHPTGNSNVRAVASAFDNASILAEFNTTIAIHLGAKWLKLLPISVKEQLLRRDFSLDSHLIKTHPFYELARMTLPKLGLSRYIKSENSWAGIDSVYRNFDKVVSDRLELSLRKDKCTAVYAYEDGALKIFQKAKTLGLTCIYDLPIAYWETGRKLMIEESLRLPAWSITLAGGIKDSADKLERKREEMALADIVVTPGDFVMNSLPAWTKDKKIIMSPFGSPTAETSTTKIKITAKTNRLRVLFVGSMSQRKGLGDLFEAIKLLNSKEVELLVMGSPIASMDFYFNELPDFSYLPNRPHDQVLSLMRSCDVLCLPSIVEGRALVMQEAMSQGLPVIITRNTGGADLVIEGVTGFLIPIRSPVAIAEKLQWFLDNKDKLEEMSGMAQVHAAKYTWEAYGNRIVSAILSNS